MLEHEDLEAAEQRVVNGTVGGQLQPPSPYSVEGMRAASQRLAEVMTLLTLCLAALLPIIGFDAGSVTCLAWNAYVCQTGLHIGECMP